MILDLDGQQDKNSPIFECSVLNNPRCSLKFFRYAAFLKHKNRLSNCVTKLRDTTQQEEGRQLHINKTGISEKYQQMTAKETRKMMFSKEWAPKIHKSVLSTIVQENFP